MNNNLKIYKIMRKRLLTMTAAVLLISGFTSCVYDRDEMPASNTAQGSLTITIKSDDFDAPITRAAVDNQADQDVDIENTITVGQTVIAIFDNTGKIITVAQPDEVDNKLSLTSTSNDGTNWLASASEVYVAANLPTAIATTLKALTTTDDKDDFVAALSLGITDALTTNSLAGSVIPMFGHGSISNGGANNYTATVNVEHMLTKVTLNSLGVDFSQSTTPNASFTPEQVFLTNVPDNVTIDNTGAITQDAPANWYMGEVAGNGHTVPDYATLYGSNASYDADQFNTADYLGTAALTGQTEMKAENPMWLKVATAGAQVKQQYFFYTMPNLTATDAADAAKRTNLVIRGSYKENASATAEEVYYSVPIYNNTATSGASADLTGDAASMDPNKNYKLDIIIMQKGAADAYAALPSDITATLAVTCTVTSFSSSEATVSIGTTYEPTAGINNTAKVGDYFYNDGTWSSVYDTKGGTRTLVGLVFSTDVSAADRTAGYTHGYVMALTDVGYVYTDAENITRARYYWQYPLTGSGTKSPGFVNVGGSTQYTDDIGYFNAIKADLDGLAHTNTIGVNFTGYDASADDPFSGVAYDDVAVANGYEAAWAAKVKYNHDVPVSNCSGWYQPSVGQLYAMAYNFAGRTAWSGLPFIIESKGREGEFNEYHDCYYKDGADITTTTLNNYLTSRLATAAGLTPDVDYQPFIARVPETLAVVYWSSSDYSAFYGLGLMFSSGPTAGLAFDWVTKSYGNFVRPVLAF